MSIIEEDIPTNIKEAHIALDRDRNNRRQSFDEQKRIKTENIQKEIVELRHSLTSNNNNNNNINNESENENESHLITPLPPQTNTPTKRQSFADIRKRFSGKSIGEAPDVYYKKIIRRNLFRSSLNQRNNSITNDAEIIKSLNGQEKIEFMSSWYDVIRDRSEDEIKNNSDIFGTPDEFLSSLGITKESCDEEEWREWVISLSKSAAYDRSLQRRRSSSTTDHESKILPNLNYQQHSQSQPEQQPPLPPQTNTPTKRQSFADIRKRFSGKSIGEAPDVYYKKIIRRNISCSSSNERNNSITNDAEIIKSLNGQEKIEFMSSWYDVLREDENDRIGTPDEFLSSLGITKESCDEEEWREWVISLSKSAAYDRSLQRRRSSSTASNRKSLTIDKNNTILEDLPYPISNQNESKNLESTDPQIKISASTTPPSTSTSTNSNSKINESKDDQSINLPTDSSSSPTNKTTPLSQSTSISSTPTQSFSTQQQTSFQTSPPRSSHFDDYHSQVIPSSSPPPVITTVTSSSSSSSSRPVQYKKSLSAASVVFAQAPEEDRESLWSSVELNYSDVSFNSSQSSYLVPIPSTTTNNNNNNTSTLSPIHRNNNDNNNNNQYNQHPQHISIDNSSIDASSNNNSSSSSNCCIII